jgi:copper homeostasis protein
MNITEKAIFEVCAFNIQCAIIADKAGAARVELCDNPVEGGTTPSYGAIKQTREAISILLYPIIRPRAGNYFYDDYEFAIMKNDIAICKELGCNGISVGVQTINGKIDTERLKQIVDLAYPMGVTCNRAFDVAPDPCEALEDLVSIGCERVLTSGLKSAASDAAELLQQLVQQAAGRIVVMPGAGINSGNIAKLMSETGAREFHGSARKIQGNRVTFSNPAVLDFGNVYVTDEAEVRKIVQILDAAAGNVA